jgi:katanin p60 ATPase-containing subunit A1
VFEINLKGVAVDKDVNFDELVKKTEGYSGADITNICREAAFMQMRRKLEHGNGKDGYDIMNIVNNKEFQEEINAPVYQKDILAAIKNISKSVSKNDLKRYEDWTNEFSNK